MNTVFNFEVDNLFINTECAIFFPNKVFKHSKPERKLDQFTCRSFPRKELCVVDTLQEYLTQRKLRVDCNIKKLFITLKAPWHEASIDTLRRWIYDLFSGSQLLKNFTPQLQSCSNKQSQKINCKYGRYFETRLLEKYENFQKTLWKINNLLCRWWCRLHEDNKLDLVLLKCWRYCTFIPPPLSHPFYQ